MNHHVSLPVALPFYNQATDWTLKRFPTFFFRGLGKGMKNNNTTSSFHLYIPKHILSTLPFLLQKCLQDVLLSCFCASFLVQKFSHPEFSFPQNEHLIVLIKVKLQDSVSILLWTTSRGCYSTLSSLVDILLHLMSLLLTQIIQRKCSSLALSL